MRQLSKIKKVKPSSLFSTKMVFLWGALFAVVGVATLLAIKAAPVVVIDGSVPQPRNVKTYGDDRNIIVTWDKPTSTNGIIGYYLTYKKKGATTTEKVRQTTHTAIQLQPLNNGQEYEISVHSARGTIQASGQNRWARGDGHVSNPVVANGTPSSARVDAERSRLTGFFDDFNIPANPFDELKWNNTASGCTDKNGAAQFINPQFHAHNFVRTGWCDRGVLASRPRAVLDATAATEANPAQIEMDWDGVSFPRDVWYMDLIPEDARTNKLPLDHTSHVNTFDDDHEDPGNIIRMNVKNGQMNISYFNPLRVAHSLSIAHAQCPATFQGPTIIDLRWCNMTNKTPGLSPLPQSTVPISPTIPNVRRHWVFQLTPTKLRVFVDSTKILETNLPAEFAAKKRIGVHSTMISYNTGKDFSSTEVHPTFHTHQVIHWDNFGFNGPASDTVIHNYIDGGANGTTPTYFVNSGTNLVPYHQRQTIIPVPDDIGSLKNNEAHLYFTLQPRGYQIYRWVAGDHILFNGVRYDFPNPKLSMNNPKTEPEIAQPGIGYSAVMKLPASAIRKGNNTVKFNIKGDWDTDIHNAHLELPYAKSNPSIPGYTQPIQIFGQAYSNIVEPPVTNCASYNYFEQDLGLPYLPGVTNLPIGDCVYLAASAHHNPDHFSGGSPPLPPPDTTKPTVNLTAPANNTQVTNNSVTAKADATDNVGVTSVTFYVGTVEKGSDNSAPYEANLDFTSLAPGNYPIYAIARDAAGNFQQSSSVNVTKPQPADTTKPTVSITEPVNNFVVPLNSTGFGVTATANDNVGVTRVDFYLDNSMYGSDPGGPFSTIINPGSLQLGPHTLYAKAYDAAGNVQQSATITFTIPTPPPETCPPGTTGTPPNCTPIPPEECPPGQIGTPPNCEIPPPPPPPGPAPKPGDITGDGKVDIFDLAILLSHWGQTVPANQNGDLTGDGKVTIFDLAILLSNYGK